MNLKTIVKIALDLLFPITCVGCGKPKIHCCEKCFSQIPLLARQKCPSCGKTSERGGFCSNKCRGGFAFDGIIAAAEFKKKSHLAELIHRFKYDFSKEICADLAKLIAAACEDFSSDNCFGAPQVFILVPAPLHNRRMRWRGFNQSALLAQKIAEIKGHAENWQTADILVRTRWTRPQVELPKQKRLMNLRGAIGLKNPHKKINPSAVYFIVDDVCTTGATIHECAKTLKERGAGRVFGLVVTRTN